MIASSVDFAVLDALAELVANRFGIELSAAQRQSFEARVAASCRASELPGLLARACRNEPQATRMLAELASTTYTDFFREQIAFEVLQAEVVPAMRREGPVRWWSAAASSGEEAWSMAIALTEADASLAARTTILATDINVVQLDAGERARYPAARVAALGERRARWFVEVPPSSVEVAPALRSRCIFRRLNLVEAPWPFQQQIDVVFLRNVLYYFSPETQVAVIERVHQVLSPRGWLFTSQTDPDVAADPRWERRAPGIYRRST